MVLRCEKQTRATCIWVTVMSGVWHANVWTGADIFQPVSLMHLYPISSRRWKWNTVASVINENKLGHLLYQSCFLIMLLRSTGLSTHCPIKLKFYRKIKQDQEFSLHNSITMFLISTVGIQRKYGMKTCVWYV